MYYALFGIIISSLFRNIIPKFALAQMNVLYKSYFNVCTLLSGPANDVIMFIIMDYYYHYYISQQCFYIEDVIN